MEPLAAREKYATLSAVLTHLDKVRADIVDNVTDLRPHPTGPPWADGAEERSTRYLVSNGTGAGSPVVFEANPT